MTRDELDEWHNDWENEKLSSGAYILYLRLYITELESNKKKSLTVQVPNEYTNINQEAFNEWMAYKKYKNKGAITKTLNMLNKYDYQTQQEMVDKSIMNEYKGLFEPKKQRNRTDNNVDVAMGWIEENTSEEQCLIK